MFVDSSNWEDALKYYGNCYVKFKESGDTIYYITSIDSQMLKAEDIHGEQIGIFVEKGYNIEYVLPKKTVFQHGESAVYLSRIPARQWKKGMCKENTKFEQLNGTEWIISPFNIYAIDGFVKKPCYYSIDNALNEFTKSEHLQSAALSPRISITRSGKIYVDTVLIGKMDFKKQQATVKYIFKPDVQVICPNLEIKVIK